MDARTGCGDAEGTASRPEEVAPVQAVGDRHEDVRQKEGAGCLAAPRTAIFMWPRTPARSPVSSVQVSPPSVDLKSPDPSPPLERDHGERVTVHHVAYGVCGLLGCLTSSTGPGGGPRIRTSQTRRAGRDLPLGRPASLQER